MTVTSRAVDAVMEATVVPSFTRIGLQVRRRLYRHWQPIDALDASGRTMLVTGANSGLGLATATRLASLGAHVHALVRSEEKGQHTHDEVRASTDRGEVTWGVADLADLPSVRAFAAEVRDRFHRLDTIVHNAGAMFDERSENDDGVEMTLAVHVVGPHVLTSELIGLLADSAPSRVIWMSSGGMYAQPLDVDQLQSQEDYSPTKAYARAKRAQVALVHQYDRRFGDRGIAFHALHPGWAGTPGVSRSLPRFDTIMGPLLRDADQGADTAVWLAVSPGAHRPSGRFWLDRRVRSEHKVPWTRYPASEEDRLWDTLAALTGASASSGS